MIRMTQTFVYNDLSSIQTFIATFLFYYETTMKLMHINFLLVLPFYLYEQLLKEMEKPLFEFKESQKKGRKEVIISYVRQCAHTNTWSVFSTTTMCCCLLYLQHQQIMERSRKQLQTLDVTIEKVCKTINCSSLHTKNLPVLYIWTSPSFSQMKTRK